MFSDEYFPALLSCRWVQWLVSFFLSLLMALVATGVVLYIVSWHYIQLHPIAREEVDLGYGLVAVFTLLCCLAVSVPVGGVLMCRIQKFIAAKVNIRNHHF